MKVILRVFTRFSTLLILSQHLHKLTLLNVYLEIIFNFQSELGRDIKAVNTLRQLLVIIRVWGLLRTTCLPMFVRSAENLDVLALLFKLLSKLVQTHEPDDTLIGKLLKTIVCLIENVLRNWLCF